MRGARSGQMAKAAGKRKNSVIGFISGNEGQESGTCASNKQHSSMGKKKWWNKKRNEK